MGALIPIGGGADAEIKRQLNTVFDPAHIGTVRSKVASEDIFEERKPHNLHRVAYRLGAYPIGNYSPDDAKGKWFYFLKKILKDASFNGVSTTKSIRKILSYAMKTKTVARVVFDAKEDASVPEHYVSPANPIEDDEIAPLVDSSGTLLVMLICPKPLPDISAPTPNKDADLDRDSHGHIIEKPPIKIFTPSILAPAVLAKKKKAPKKKSKKAAVKKKASVKKRK